MAEGGISSRGYLRAQKSFKQIYTEPKRIAQEQIQNVLDPSRYNLSYEDLRGHINERKKFANRSYTSGFFVHLGYNGTIFKFVALDLQLWITIVIYILSRYFYLFDNFKTPAIPLGPLSCIGGFVTFMLVFYTSQVYTRYLLVYDLSMQVVSRIVEATLLAKALLPIDNASRMFRHLNAAHIICYVGCTDIYSEANFFNPLVETYKLLDENELRRLSDINPDGFYRTNEVISWMIMEIQQQYVSRKITDVEKAPLLDQIIRFRTAVGGLFDCQAMPFPYIYVNFVYWVSLVYPAIFALAVAICFDATSFVWIFELVGILCVLINCVFVVGLREIAHHFHNPFGSYLEDLSVLHFVHSAVKISAQTIDSASLPLVNKGLERTYSASRMPYLAEGYDTEGSKSPSKPMVQCSPTGGFFKIPAGGSYISTTSMDSIASSKTMSKVTNFGNLKLEEDKLNNSDCLDEETGRMKLPSGA